MLHRNVLCCLLLVLLQTMRMNQFNNSVVSDETEHGFNIQCAFIYSDIMVNISQVTPVTIQNKNHLEIITFK